MIKYLYIIVYTIHTRLSKKLIKDDTDKNIYSHMLGYINNILNFLCQHHENHQNTLLDGMQYII